MLLFPKQSQNDLWNHSQGTFIQYKSWDTELFLWNLSSSPPRPQPSHKVESRRNFPLKLSSPVASKFESFIIPQCGSLFLRVRGGCVLRLQWYHDLQSSGCSPTVEIQLLSDSSTNAPSFVELFFLACRPAEKIVYFCLSQIWYLCPLVRSNRQQEQQLRLSVRVKKEKGSKKKRARQGPRVI